MGNNKPLNPQDFSPSLRHCHFSEFGDSGKNILISRLPISWGMNLLEDAKKADAPFIQSNEQGRNLLGTSMTSWSIHKEEWCVPHVSKISSHMSVGLRPKVSARAAFLLNIYDCWIVRYKNDSQLLPHNHGTYEGQWSFVWYLDVPDEGTEIMYRVGDVNMSKIVYSGDLLVFPSDIMHWSDDLHENRVIMAGNFLLTVFPKEGI